MAVTKESLIQYFSTLDVAVLEKLKKYAELLIIPDEDLLVNVTMAQMVDKAHTLADTIFPQWTDRGPSDFGEFLVELFALFSEKDFWYLNAFANEGIFAKMRSYSNAFLKASSLGYNVGLCKGASGTFNVTFESGNAYTYTRGELIVEVDGKYFSNDSPFEVANSNDSVNIPIVLSEGDQLSENVSFNGYNVFIRKSNVDIDSIQVIVNNVLYSRVGNFGESQSSSTHYVVLPEEDGSCSIHFGSNGYGASPNIGDVVQVNYRVCTGSDGNVAMQDCEVTSWSSDRKATNVSMLTDATGGVYAESLLSIKEHAPLSYIHKNIAFNSDSAKQILDSYSFVAKSNVYAIGMDVYYQVIPKSGLAEITSAEVSYIQDNFEKTLLLGYQAVYTKNIYIDFIRRINIRATKVVLDVVISVGYDSNVVENSIKQIIENITNPLVSANYGDSFSKTNTELLIRSNVQGVQSVTFKVLIGGSTQIINDFTLQNNEIFRKINTDNIIVNINAV